MKQFGILIILFIFLSLGSACNAQSQFSDTLTRMEKSLFGVDYTNQSDDARIKRLEETVYGTASSSPMQQRFNKLLVDMSADLIGKEIKPKKDSFTEDEDAYKEEIPKADSSVNYPAVDNLEKTVFNKSFKTTEINQRLANLEQNVFKKTYNDDLNSRVERLKQAVMPQRVANNEDADDYNSANSDMIPQNSQFQDDTYGADSDDGQTTGYGAQTPNYNSKNSVLDDYQSDSDILIPLGALEKKVLKKNYPDDTVSNRLLRMELKVFKSTFTEDDEQTRLDRVASAYQAQKTSKKYDSNKFSQHAAAAMQVGAILLMILAAVL